MDITSNLQKVLWLCTWIISQPGNSLACVMGLWFAWTRIIWEVLLGITDPKWLAKILNVKVGEKHLCDHRKGGEISPGELHHSGPCDQIRINIFATCDKTLGIHVHVGGEDFWKTFLSRLFFGKSKYIPPIVRTLSTIQVKKSGLGLQYPVTHKFAMCKHRADWGRNGS